MNEDGVKRFLSELGAEGFQVSRGWVNCSCPLAPYTHGSGEDKRPSFGVAVSDEGKSVYFCFGCSPKAHSLEGLLHNIWIMSGRYPHEAAKVFIEEENHGEEETPRTAPDPWEEEREEMEPLPKAVLRQFPPIQYGRGSRFAIACRTWLERERRIPTWVQYLYQVRYDPKRRGVVTFPLTDASGRVFLLRQRSTWKKEMWTVSPSMAGMEGAEFPRLSRAGVWFGMFLAKWSRPLLLVEGEIDCMRAASLGFFNTIASATASVTDAQIDALSAGTIILGYDADEAGRKAHARIARRVGPQVTLFEVDWSEVGCKDPGEIKDEKQFNEVIGKARPYRSK